MVDTPYEFPGVVVSALSFSRGVGCRLEYLNSDVINWLQSTLVAPLDLIRDFCALLGGNFDFMLRVADWACSLPRDTAHGDYDVTLSCGALIDVLLLSAAERHERYVYSSSEATLPWLVHPWRRYNALRLSGVRLGR